MAGPVSNCVVINISGQRFMASLSLLNNETESYLAQLIREHVRQFPSQVSSLANKGNMTAVQHSELFLCRDPSVFQYVINYLRGGNRAIFPMTTDHETLQRLIKEAEFYQLHGLMPLIWRTMHGVPMILPPLQVDHEVCWNPGTFTLYWRSVAVMTHCFEPRRAHYQVIGFMKSAYQLTKDSTWWCYDVRCPSCSSFDFAPVDGGVDFGTMEIPVKAAMRSCRGKVVRKICDGKCVLVDWDRGWRFHMPASALLPCTFLNTK